MSREAKRLGIWEPENHGSQGTRIRKLGRASRLEQPLTRKAVRVQPREIQRKLCIWVLIGHPVLDIIQMGNVCPATFEGLRC